MERKAYGRYVEGSSAKKIDFEQERRKAKYQRGTAVPKRQEDTREVPSNKELRKKKPQTKEVRRASYRHMDSESMRLGTVAFMAAMVGIVFVMCVSYLNCQADIRETKSNINSLKSGIDVLASQNDSVAYDIEAYIDINRIIGIATGELGMVRADDSQIKYFEKNVDEFMNQYTDVPEN